MSFLACHIICKGYPHIGYIRIAECEKPILHNRAFSAGEKLTIRLFQNVCKPRHADSRIGVFAVEREAAKLLHEINVARILS